MQWNNLANEAQIDKIIEQSYKKPVLIYKHSTRCNISDMAMEHLENQGTKKELSKYAEPYYLDLIRFREISRLIEEKFNVRHQSPQILLIRNGKAVYNASHMGISAEPIIKNVNHQTVS